jgi:predicted esterase
MLTAPWAAKSRWELGQLARAAVPRGYTVIGLRGLKGLCDWSDDARQSFCWPNGLRQEQQIQPIIDRMREALAEASVRAKTEFKPPFIVGFSNGGFLVSLIASDTRFAVSAYAIAHGGPVIGQGFPPWRRRPMLLVTANGDSAHFPRMKLLAQMLGEDRWESTFTVREGVHEMTVDDMKAIVDFFDKV